MLCFPMINSGAFKHNAMQVSADVVHFSTEIQFWQSLESICRQSVLQVVAMSHRLCCLLESFKNF